jgi:hypothetical protein
MRGKGGGMVELEDLAVTIARIVVITMIRS